MSNGNNSPPPGPPPLRPPRPSGGAPTPPAPPLSAARPATPIAASRAPQPVIPRRPLGAASPPGAPFVTLGRPTVQARGLRHTFAGNGSFVLTIPQLALMPGELTYIGGESGSGKSTLIKFLALEALPESGEIVVMDRPVRALPERDLDDLRGGGITYIPQSDLGLTDHTAIQNIERTLHDHDNLGWGEARQAAHLALQTVGLKAERCDQRIKLLSGGEKARVALAKVYARGRPICLADEILPALDADSRLMVLRLLQRLAAEGFTVAIIAHQPELKGHFHRVIEMRAGSIIGDQRQSPKAL